MNKKIISKLECELKNIGDQIKLWRENREFRNILELKSFKTQADNKANNLIKHLLNKLDPDAIILSEEDEYLDDTRPEKYWLIDPIDGTASWYDGFDGFVTQLAYIENNQTLYGAVYAPVMNKFWSAIKGDGAFLNGKRLHRLKTIDRLKLVDNYSEPQHIAKNIFDNFNVSEYIECGSLGLKSCLVADGSADLFVKDITFRDWDIAPVILIMEEVGGVLIDLDGKQVKLSGSFEKNNGLVVARDSILSKKVVNFVRKLYGK